MMSYQYLMNSGWLIKLNTLAEVMQVSLLRVIKF